jgi:thiamine pyrophosphate-dependent acetolactate synthase large subunit-like protein
VRAVNVAWLNEGLPRLTSDHVPISPCRVIWCLTHTVDRRRATVTHDTGNPGEQMVPFYVPVGPCGHVGSGKSTQPGTRRGLMMGAKFAAPDRLVVNLTGDAAFGMAGMHFETASPSPSDPNDCHEQQSVGRLPEIPTE